MPEPKAIYVKGVGGTETLDLSLELRHRRYVVERSGWLSSGRPMPRGATERQLAVSNIILQTCNMRGLPLYEGCFRSFLRGLRSS